MITLPKLPDHHLHLRWATPADNPQLLELAFHALDEDETEYPFVKIFVQDWVDGKFPMLRHPDMTVIEDTITGKLVSAMCLISENWRYSDAPIKVGRPELVMTHEGYRRRGLIHQQFEVIHALSAARGEVMQIITGIPSFYRKFGYELALQLGGGYRIYPPDFPKLNETTANDYHLRAPTSKADYAFLRKMHEENTRQMLFSIDVDDATWAYEIDGYTNGSDGKFHWLLIEDKRGKPIGYVHHQHIFWGPVMNINFLALKHGVGYLNLLPHLLHGLWQIAQRKFVDDSFEHPAEEIRGLCLRLGREHPIYDAIGRDAMQAAPPYAWYTRIPDETAFLQAIQPELEKHLSKSAGAGFTGELKLNFYGRGTQLNFQDGKLHITPWQPADGSDGDAHFPANSFWSVICGQKSAAQLHDEIPDCWMSRTARALLGYLFSPFNGQVWVVGGGA